MRNRIWKPSLVGCPSQVSFQVEPFEPFLPRARHSAFPLPPEINWLATAVGWQPQSIAGAFKSQFNFWNNICYRKRAFGTLRSSKRNRHQNHICHQNPKFVNISCPDSCQMLVLRRIQHDKIEIFIEKMVDSVTEIPCHQQFCHLVYDKDIRHRHRCIQINPSDLISVSSRRFINIP